MEERMYPMEFKSMEDVFYAYKTFPRETWEKDFQDLVARTQGIVLIGKNPSVNDENHEIAADPVFDKERTEVLKHSDDWKNLHTWNPENVEHEDLYKFSYNGVTYLGQYGTLPYAISTWVDTDWILNKLYDLDKVKDQIERHEKEIAEATKDVIWVNDEGKEVDENDNVIGESEGQPNG